MSPNCLRGLNSARAPGERTQRLLHPLTVDSGRLILPGFLFAEVAQSVEHLGLRIVAPAFRGRSRVGSNPTFRSPSNEPNAALTGRFALRMAGRPSLFTDEIAAEICERLSEGETLRSICRDEHMPAWRTVYDWIEGNTGFSAAFARARELGFDAIAEDTLGIIDTPAEMARSWTEGGGGSEHRDSAHVAWLKNRVEQRMKLLAKWSPKYREKLTQEHTGPGGGPIQTASVELTPEQQQAIAIEVLKEHGRL